jgi:hypothetical protein
MSGLTYGRAIRVMAKGTKAENKRLRLFEDCQSKAQTLPNPFNALPPNAKHDSKQ